MSRVLFVLPLAALAAACPGERWSAADLGDARAPVDGAGASAEARDLPTVYACNTVDVLFVIDNSNTMAQEQDNLAANLPKLVQRIEAIQPRIKSYRLGVVSTDLGAGPYTIGTCKPKGDEGRLLHAPHGAGCAASYPRWLEGPSPTLAQDFACVAKLGVGGCGYEQQLEAALRALTAQPENAGFLRSNAPLAIIFISDEDDCSAKDEKLFDPDDAALGALSTRCVRLVDKLHPVARYSVGFRALKDNPKRVVVAAITGPAGPVQLDPGLPTGMKPICSSPQLGEATPGNRFAELVQSLGERGVQASLCDGDLSNALDVIGKAIERSCLE
jgi:uncharacterized protein YfcZ (UPF0381/DUF406 family)